MAENTIEKSKTMGNTSLISKEEDAVAQMLRERNLERTNMMSAPVNPASSFYTKYGKRMLDILISLPIFCVLLPFNLVFAVCTFFDVGRPILYKQTRCGRNGKPFTMVKFRNMNNKTDEEGRLLPASQRVTKFGRIMRKYSLDELLNFWNVLKGDMSIIGPRPVPMFFEERMSNRHKMRHAVRPGLECPNMIPNPGEDVSRYQWKFENDIWYVENVSFKTDVRMIFRLVELTLNMKVRGSHAGAMSYFVGYDENGLATSLNKVREDAAKAEQLQKQSETEKA